MNWSRFALRIDCNLTGRSYRAAVGFTPSHTRAALGGRFLRFPPSLTYFPFFGAAFLRTGPPYPGRQPGRISWSAEAFLVSRSGSQLRQCQFSWATLGLRSSTAASFATGGTTGHVPRLPRQYPGDSMQPEKIEIRIKFSGCVILPRTVPVVFQVS